MIIVTFYLKRFFILKDIVL